MSIGSRSKMISFRLSANEYERFRTECFTQGIKSLSEMARVAINVLLQEPGPAARGVLECRVNELEARLHLLALEIKKLNQGLALSRPDEPLEIRSSFSS